MLITEEYRALNRELHERNVGYGTSSAKWVEDIAKLAYDVPTFDILDYGSGAGLLKKGLAEVAPQLMVREYDPAIPGLEAEPEPADLVVCSDVLEHIEQNCLDDVLDDLQRVTRHVGFFTVATRPAIKTLADGRNAHLIVEPMEWWLPKIRDRFVIGTSHDFGGEFLLLVGRLPMSMRVV